MSYRLICRENGVVTVQAHNLDHFRSALRDSWKAVQMASTLNLQSNVNTKGSSSRSKKNKIIDNAAQQFTRKKEVDASVPDDLSLDFTIQCRDGAVKVHAVVMAAAFSLARDVITGGECLCYSSHQSLGLLDNTRTQINKILELIYIGWCSIGNEDIKPILTTLKYLKIAGDQDNLLLLRLCADQAAGPRMLCDSRLNGREERRLVEYGHEDEKQFDKTPDTETSSALPVESEARDKQVSSVDGENRGSTLYTMLSNTDRFQDDERHQEGAMQCMTPNRFTSIANYYGSAVTNQPDYNQMQQFPNSSMPTLPGHNQLKRESPTDFYALTTEALKPATLKMPSVDPPRARMPIVYPSGARMPIAYPSGARMPIAYPPGARMPIAYPSGARMPIAYPPGARMSIIYPPAGARLPTVYPPGLRQPLVYPPGARMPSVYPHGPGIPIVDHPGSRMPSVDHSGSGMPYIDHPGPRMPNVDHSGSGMPYIDHPGPRIPNVDHPGPRMPNVDHPGSRMPKVDHLGSRMPNIDHPGPRIPNVDHPGSRMPKVDHLGSRMPNIDHPGPRIPNVDHPGPRMLNVEYHGPRMPNVDHPGSRMPNVDHPGSRMPNIDHPGPRIPHVYPPGVRMPSDYPPSADNYGASSNQYRLQVPAPIPVYTSRPYYTLDSFVPVCSEDINARNLQNPNNNVFVRGDTNRNTEEAKDVNEADVSSDELVDVVNIDADNTDCSDCTQCHLRFENVLLMQHHCEVEHNLKANNESSMKRKRDTGDMDEQQASKIRSPKEQIIETLERLDCCKNKGMNLDEFLFHCVRHHAYQELLFHLERSYKERKGNCYLCEKRFSNLQLYADHLGVQHYLVLDYLLSQQRFKQYWGTLIKLKERMQRDKRSDMSVTERMQRDKRPDMSLTETSGASLDVSSTTSSCSDQGNSIPSRANINGDQTTENTNNQSIRANPDRLAIREDLEDNQNINGLKRRDAQQQASGSVKMKKLRSNEHVNPVQKNHRRATDYTEKLGDDSTEPQKNVRSVAAMNPDLAPNECTDSTSKQVKKFDFKRQVDSTTNHINDLDAEADIMPPENVNPKGQVEFTCPRCYKVFNARNLILKHIVFVHYNRQLKERLDKDFLVKMCDCKVDISTNRSYIFHNAVTHKVLLEFCTPEIAELVKDVNRGSRNHDIVMEDADEIDHERKNRSSVESKGKTRRSTRSAFSCQLCGVRETGYKTFLSHLTEKHYRTELKTEYGHLIRHKQSKFQCPHCGEVMATFNLTYHLGTRHEAVLKYATWFTPPTNQDI